MSIHFITGKPGGGKGLFAMQKIYDELVNGQRPIVSNLAVMLNPWIFNAQAQLGLRQYLLNKHGNTFDVDQRMWILSDEQMAEFYRYRLGPAGARVELDVERDAKGKPVSFDTAPAIKNGGCLYVVDEAWK